MQRDALLGAVITLGMSCTSSDRRMDVAEPTRFEIRLAAHEYQSGFITMVIPETGEPLYVSPDVTLSNADIRNARYIRDGRGQPSVEIELTEAGRRTFAAFTAEHIGEMAVFLVNGQVSSAPVIRDTIPGGRAIITGRFTEAEARDLAHSIVSRAGGG